MSLPLLACGAFVTVNWSRHGYGSFALLQSQPSSVGCSRQSGPSRTFTWGGRCRNNTCLHLAREQVSEQHLPAYGTGVEATPVQHASRRNNGWLTVSRPSEQRSGHVHAAWSSKQRPVCLQSRVSKQHPRPTSARRRNNACPLSTPSSKQRRSTSPFDWCRNNTSLSHSPDRRNNGLDRHRHSCRSNSCGSQGAPAPHRWFGAGLQAIAYLPPSVCSKTGRGHPGRFNWPARPSLLVIVGPVPGPPPCSDSLCWRLSCAAAYAADGHGRPKGPSLQRRRGSYQILSLQSSSRGSSMLGRCPPCAASAAAAAGGILIGFPDV